MPPIWSGTLTFGLVAIPIRMESATRSHKVAFRQIHLEDQGRVRYQKTCEEDGQILEQSDIGRAYEAGDTLVPIEDHELDDLPLPTAKTLEVSGFVDLASVPVEMYDQPYYLAPASPAANKPYVLMRDALAKSGKAAVGKYALRGSGEALGLVHAKGRVLVLQRIRWPDEVRAAGDAAPRGGDAPTEDELAAAEEYITAMGDLDMAAMHDEYAEAVRALVEAKVEHKAPPKVPPRRQEAGVTDLMTALQRAAEQARADRGEDAQVHPMPAKKAARKTAAKTAKKQPAKKTPAKKTGGRKKAG